MKKLIALAMIAGFATAAFADENKGRRAFLQDRALQEAQGRV